MKIHTCRQGSDEWLELRRGIPTASQFKRIITPEHKKLSSQAFGYICELIAEKHDQHFGEREDYVSAAMKNGMILEPDARRAYEFHAGIEVDEVGFITTDDGKVGCSPDAIIGELAVVELKCPDPKKHVEWFIRDELPDEHKCQVHGELLVTGSNYADFVSYCPGFPLFVVRVEPNDFTKKLAEVMEKFLTMYETTERQLGWPLPPSQHEEIELPAALAQ